VEQRPRAVTAPSPCADPRTGGSVPTWYDEDQIVVCWNRATSVIRVLGDYCRTRVVVGARLATNTNIYVTRWSEAAEPEMDGVPSVLRELRPAQGEPVCEP
jgi:hypothetical protein